METSMVSHCGRLATWWVAKGTALGDRWKLVIQAVASNFPGSGSRVFFVLVPGALNGPLFAIRGVYRAV